VPRETIGINLSSEPVYECGAVFLACIAHPENEKRRIEFWQALCRQVIVENARQDDEFAWRRQAIKPGFLTMSEERAEKVLKDSFKVLNQRIIAAHRYLMPFVQQKLSTRPLRIRDHPVLVGDMALIAIGDLEDLSKEFESAVRWRWDENRDAPIANVKSRVFGPARPVIHAAAALSHLTQLCETQLGNRFPAFVLLNSAEVLEVVVSCSEQFRLLIVDKIEMPRIRDDETIQFVVQ
jgi:hypothetical protein